MKLFYLVMLHSKDRVLNSSVSDTNAARIVTAGQAGITATSTAGHVSDCDYVKARTTRSKVF
jgi:hypothetical protein